MKRVLVSALLAMATSAIGQPINDDVRSGQLVFSASYIHDKRPWTFVLLDLKTGSQQPLADYNGDAAAPTWSRDGWRLLYSLNRDCDGVYLYDIREHRTERIDEHSEYGGGCQAAWSPHEQVIAYMSAHEGTLPNLYYDLYTFDLRTKARRRLTTRSGGFPTWSPDGQWIIVGSLRQIPWRLTRCGVQCVVDKLSVRIQEAQRWHISQRISR